MNSQDIASILTTMLENGTLGSGTGTIIACVVIAWMVKSLLSPLKSKFDEIAKEETINNLLDQSKKNNEEIVKLNSYDSTQFSNIINQLKSIESRLESMNSQNKSIDDNVKTIHTEIQNIKNTIDNNRLQMLQDQLNRMK